MKKLLIGTAFVAMFATPAFAQSFDPDFGTGNTNPPLASIYGGQRYDSHGLTAQGPRSGNGAYAYVPVGPADGYWGWNSPGWQAYIQRQDSQYPVYENQY